MEVKYLTPREECTGAAGFLGSHLCERLLKEGHQVIGMDIGPRMRLDDCRVVPNFIQQALRGEALTIYGEGDQTRSFCYVDDLIEGLYRLLLSDEHDPVNIGNPSEITIREFAETIDRIVGNLAGIIQKTALRMGDDPQRRRPDITRAKELLSWEPKISLEQGIRRTIPYFKEKMALE